MIQHSFVDDRAYLYHILKEGRAISLPQILLIGIVRVLNGMVGYMSSNSQIITNSGNISPHLNSIHNYLCVFIIFIPR